MVVFPPGRVFLAPSGGGGHMMPLPGVGARLRRGGELVMVWMIYCFICLWLLYFFIIIFVFYWLGVVIWKIGRFLMWTISPTEHSLHVLYSGTVTLATIGHEDIFSTFKYVFYSLLAWGAPYDYWSYGAFHESGTVPAFFFYRRM